MARATVNGFSLLELMVSLALGLLVVAGGALLFADSGRNNALLQAQARMNDNARFALQFLTRDMRMAGFGCAKTSPAVESVERNKFRGDTVRVHYALPAEGEVMHELNSDCAATSDKKLRRREYQARRDVSGTSVLYLRDWDADKNKYKNRLPLVDGVEYLRVLYGVDTDADGAVNSYTDNIAAGATVRALRIGLLVRSISAAGGESGELPVDTAEYTVLGATVRPPNLRVLRRIVTASVHLRNR